MSSVDVKRRDGDVEHYVYADEHVVVCGSVGSDRHGVNHEDRCTKASWLAKDAQGERMRRLVRSLLGEAVVRGTGRRLLRASVRRMRGGRARAAQGGSGRGGGCSQRPTRSAPARSKPSRNAPWVTTAAPLPPSRASSCVASSAPTVT